MPSRVPITNNATMNGAVSSQISPPSRARPTKAVDTMNRSTCQPGCCNPGWRTAESDMNNHFFRSVEKIQDLAETFLRDLQWPIAVLGPLGHGTVIQGNFLKSGQLAEHKPICGSPMAGVAEGDSTSARVQLCLVYSRRDLTFIEIPGLVSLAQKVRMGKTPGARNSARSLGGW